MYLLASRQHFLSTPEYCSCIITTAENENAIAIPVAFEKLDIECKDAFNAEISPNITAMKTIK